jgi:hypothetical protein
MPPFRDCIIARRHKPAMSDSIITHRRMLETDYATDAAYCSAIADSGIGLYSPA